ncbi:hypothetical protein AURANDRAFT_68829, partial [Aureococcus anophagefferens]
RGGTIWRGAAAHGAPVDPAQRADAAAVSRIAKKLRNRACERGERVRLLELVDDVCSAHGVRSLRDLGLSVAAVDELRSLRQLEGLLEIQICAFVESRFIATLHDLSHNLCAAHGVRAFEDLRLGPILKQPLVQRKFYADEALTAVPALEVADVVRELEKFRFKKRRVDLEEFLNWLAAKRGVASPRSLCLTMSKYAIGTTIKYASQAARDEKDSRVAALKQLRDARRDEWRAALGAKVEAGSSAARLGAQLSDAARLAVVEYGGLGATEPFGKVAGKIASAVVAAKNAKKKLSVAAELAACYVVTLGEIDVEATRLAVAEAQGLTDHDVANEVREAARALDAEGTVFDALAAAERAAAERLRIPSFEALQRGSFLAFASRNADAVAPLAARFAAAAGGVAAGVPDDGDDDGDGDGGADDGSTAVSALDEACERALSRGLSGLDALAAVEAAVSTAAPRAWAPGGFALWLSGLADRAGVRAVVAGAGGGGPAPTRVAERVAAAADALGGDLDAARLARKLGVADLAALGCGADVAAFVRRCSEAARPGARGPVADYVAAPRARAAPPADPDRLGRALEAAPPLADLGARLRWRFHGRGDLAEFCAARRVSVVVAEDRVYKLLAEPSLDGLGAACARGDAAGAAAHVATLVVKKSRDAAELLRECLRDGLLRLGGSGGDAVALACEVIAAAPPPLRPPVADALLPALEAARGIARATERDLLAVAKRAGLVDALRDLADRLRPETRAALGVEALDASHALRLAAALADADDLGAPVFLEWAALLYRAAAPAGGVSAADRDRLRSLAVVPLAGGGRGAPGAAPIYVDRGEGAEPLEGFAAVRADLAVVDPAVLAPSLARPMVVSVLRSAGVKDATAEAVCLEHVLPALAAADAGEDRKRLNARWRFARAYFLTLRGSKRDRLLEALRGCAVPHGAFDVLRELSTLARRLEWRYVALHELATSREQAAGWLDFLRLVGCVEFPKPAPRMLERDAWPDAWAAAARDVFSVGDARVVAHDVHSEALERLLAELARDAKPANEAVVRALCAAARWAAPMAKTTATLARPGAREGPGLVPSQVSRERASVPSSTATLLAETRWVPGAAGGATRLFRPRELYSPLLGLSELYGPRVPVPTDGVRDAARDSPRPYAALGLRDSFGARDALLVLETWAAEEGPFEATVAHFENLYRLLYQELQRRGGAAAAIREFFARGKCTWVPDYRYEAEADDGKRAVVPGAFYALSDCVWADHSRVIDSCVHRGLSAAAPRVLQRHYGSLQGFFCRRLCPACYGDGLGSRGADACPRCYDDGVSSGRPRALVPTAHDLAGHIAIAAALAELDVPHASACADVEAVLRVVSFAILAGRLSEQNVAFLPHLLRGKKVWPTSCGAFAAAEGDRILVIDDDEGLRETLFADADVAAAIAVVAARAAARERVDLAVLGVPAGGEAEWLAERLGAMRLAGVPVDATGGDLAGAFDALAGSTLPLLAAVGVRPLSQLVETKTFHEGVQFSRHALHDELAALLPRAQRWLRSERRDLYDARGAAWASFAAGLRPRVCDALHVVHTIRGHAVRVEVPAFLIGGDRLLYVARGALDDGDWDPVLRAVAEHFVGRGDAATTLSDALAMTRTYGDKHFDRRA